MHPSSFGLFSHLNRLQNLYEHTKRALVSLLLNIVYGQPRCHAYHGTIVE